MASRSRVRLRGQRSGYFKMPTPTEVALDFIARLLATPGVQPLGVRARALEPAGGSRRPGGRPRLRDL